MNSMQQPSQAARVWPFRVGATLHPSVAGPARLRSLLSELGPLAESELAQAAGLESPGLVRALLKLDLHLGKVQLVEGRYQILPEPDQAEQSRIEEATRFLEARGFVVSRKPNVKSQY
ncbi:hypothetical protein [Acidovorax sp.]|uniref:hypothetical protein n=1 Tax=Acidovorax sp. TaxID=1872122 RepID=UPI0027B99BB2|nr:hypothetical protein [Acidovorax sp.]